MVVGMVYMGPCRSYIINGKYLVMLCCKEAAASYAEVCPQTPVNLSHILLRKSHAEPFSTTRTCVRRSAARRPSLARYSMIRAAIAKEMS